MPLEKGVVWLASYPKSGNTWFRIVLSNVLHDSADPVSINRINKGTSASSRELINRALGFDSLLLTQAELDKLKPAIYTWYAQHTNKIRYFKTHSAYIDSATGCRGAIYFIRNPLDVAISFAHHCHFSIDYAIKIMADPQYATIPTQYGNSHYVRERYLSWSRHVQSWTLQNTMDIVVLRYEDMTYDPLNTFKKAFDFIQTPVLESVLIEAIEQSRFDKLQQQEQQFGFVEKSVRQKSNFFRKGKVGDWETTLSNRQIQRVIRTHAEIMHQYGYLDDHGHPIRDYKP